MEIVILSTLAGLLVVSAALRLPRARSLGPHGLTRYAALTIPPGSADRTARGEEPGVLDAPGPPADAALLIEHLAVDSPAIRATVARCLGHVATPGALDALVELLDDPSVAVQVAAAEALGASATTDLIAPLRARGVSGARSASFKRAARDAVARIQARHRRDPGRLSLVLPGPRGALALADVPSPEPASLPSQKVSSCAVTRAPSASTTWRAL